MNGAANTVLSTTPTGNDRYFLIANYINIAVDNAIIPSRRPLKNEVVHIFTIIRNKIVYIVTITTPTDKEKYSKYGNTHTSTIIQTPRDIKSPTQTTPATI